MTATGDVAGRIQHNQSTEMVRKGLSRHFPVPVAIFARLAVKTRAVRARVWARVLLNDAIERICRASQEVAVRAVVVYAIDEDVCQQHPTRSRAEVGDTCRRTI